MGFGPTLPDSQQALRAIREVVELLYPEFATEKALGIIEQIAAALLEAKAPLSFEKMDRFLRDPNWREEIRGRAPHTFAPWEPYRGSVIDPQVLDPHFAGLLANRLQANGHEQAPPEAGLGNRSGDD